MSGMLPCQEAELISGEVGLGDVRFAAEGLRGRGGRD
jgi:hypothetical protein